MLGGEQCPYLLLGREGRNLSWVFWEQGVTREAKIQGHRAEETQTPSLICMCLDDWFLIILVPRLRTGARQTSSSSSNEAPLQKRICSHGHQAYPPPRGQHGGFTADCLLLNNKACFRQSPRMKYHFKFCQTRENKVRANPTQALWLPALFHGHVGRARCRLFCSENGRCNERKHAAPTAIRWVRGCSENAEEAGEASGLIPLSKSP